MAWTTPYVFVALDTLTAAQLNTVQANISTLFPYTAIGDMAYANSTTTLVRLAPPTLYSKMVHSGTAPAWVPQSRSYAYRSVSNFQITNIALTSIELNTEVEDENWHSNTVNPSRITVNADGRYDACAMGAIYNNSGVTIVSLDVGIYLSGSFITAQNFFNVAHESTVYFNLTAYEGSLSSGQYFEIKSSRSNSEPSDVLLTNGILQVRRWR